jgi:DNA polymerase-4
VLLELVEDVGQRLRASARYAGVAHLKLRWQGFETITRQKAFPRPVCDDFSLREAARGLFLAQTLKKPVRLVGFGVSRLSGQFEEQLSLFDAEQAAGRRREDLSRAVDAIRRRLGDGSIGRAARGRGA